MPRIVRGGQVADLTASPRAVQGQVERRRGGGTSRRRGCHSAGPPSPFSRSFNGDGERASASQQNDESRQWLGETGIISVQCLAGHAAVSRSQLLALPRRPSTHFNTEGFFNRPVAVGRTVILLHLPLPLVGVSIAMEAGRRQSDNLAGGGRPLTSPDSTAELAGRSGDGSTGLGGSGQRRWWRRRWRRSRRPAEWRRLRARRSRTSSRPASRHA